MVVGWGAGTVDLGLWPAYGQCALPYGLRNVREVAAGAYHSLARIDTGPPGPGPQVLNPQLRDGTFSVSVPTASGRVYVLEYADALAENPWTALPLVAGDGAVKRLVDPAASGPQRFYRVRQW